MRYSQFYGESDAQSKWLVSELCETQEEATKYEYAAPSIVDTAVFQLKKFGIVQTEQLSEKLMDGEPDYSIRLTSHGRKFINNRGEIPYHDKYFID